MNRWLVLSVALTGAALAGSLYVWNAELLPERVPTHWDINFEPDRWTLAEACAPCSRRSCLEQPIRLPCQIYSPMDSP